ncbi:MAG: hypothetical protein IKR93_08980 [Firmicutes bacterium]|nr:hypothetical protein [Bacillota bacterium]
MIEIKRPAAGNPYYNGRPGGFSECIVGNVPKGVRPAKRTGAPGLDRLPNCVGYAVGFLNESNSCRKFTMIGSRPPYAMIAEAEREGLEVTERPTVGGLMIWSKNGASGHCCVVKEILDDETVVTADSEWNGLVYAEYTRRKGEGDWRSGCYWMNTAYHYRGCIKNPAFENEVENMTIDEFIEKMTPEQAYKLEEKARQYAKTLPVDRYAEDACRQAVEVGAAADGNGDGMADAPRASMLREEFFVVLKRLGLLQ